MKVCFVHRDPSSGGTSIEEIFQGLIEVLEEKISIQQFHYNKRHSLLHNLRRLKQMNADIYHITGGVYFIAPFIRHKKVIITIHDIGHFRQLKGIKRWIFGLLYFKWPIYRADAITSVSEFTADNLRQWFGDKIQRKLYVIPNPVPGIFLKMERPFQKIKPRILQVGTNLNKNLDSVIKAINGLDVILVIIGELLHDDKLQLEKHSISYENYSRLNYTEVYEQYCLADIVIFVSTYEGFGMPVIEAQATGRPVIASYITSIPEVGGKGVHYIQDPFNVQEIREGILKVINDDTYRAKLINEGFRNVQRYDKERIAKEYLSLYKSV